MGDFQADICPVCGHAGLDYETRDVQEDVLVYPWTCPQCKSKGDEEYTISFNTHFIRKGGRMPKMELKYIGIDSWDRPVYQEVGTTKLWKDTNLAPVNSKRASLNRACNDEFDGEPDYPLTREYEFVT